LFHGFLFLIHGKNRGVSPFAKQKIGHWQDFVGKRMMKLQVTSYKIQIKNKG